MDYVAPASDPCEAEIPRSDERGIGQQRSGDRHAELVEGVGQSRGA